MPISSLIAKSLPSRDRRERTRSTIYATPLTPEFHLLIASSWLHSTEIATLCAAVTHWDEFLTLVRRHQVPSLAYKILPRKLLPIDIHRELKNLNATACAAALHTAAELARLSRAFAAEGIAVMPLKGVMLSLHLYGDPATRHPGDLDLMIHPQDFPRTRELLLSLGYQSKLSRRMQELLRTHSHECSYWNERLQLLVDVHWGQESWTAPQISELWTSCQNTSWMGATIQSLQGDALLLFLCDHGTRHRWSRIKWLGDIAMLLYRPRDAPWSDLFEMAARFGLERPLAETARLVHDSYGIEFPAYFPLLRKKSRRRNISSWLIQVEDLKRFPLPDPLVWLYYPLRPVFWFWRHFKAK